MNLFVAGTRYTKAVGQAVLGAGGYPLTATGSSRCWQAFSGQFSVKKGIDQILVFWKVVNFADHSVFKLPQ